MIVFVFQRYSHQKRFLPRPLSLLPPFDPINGKRLSAKEPEQLFSGENLISERFAEVGLCSNLFLKPTNLRKSHLPAILSASELQRFQSPHDQGNTQQFWMTTQQKPLIVEMLGEVMRLQKRAIDDKNAKARRRLVVIP